jgi:SAM-dependent methyltransferase
MAEEEIRFDDGEAYERFMGGWSRLMGEDFLRWLALPEGLDWVDVGCGNGAFTDLLFDRAAPRQITGIDPSAGQLAFAETRLRGRPLTLRQGSAVSLPFADSAFDAAVMALVIFFVPEPDVGVAEMVRVTRPGGSVSAYAWDVPGGGFPSEPMSDALRAFGREPQRPPRADASTLDAMHDLWVGAGLAHVETRTFTVERDFPDFETWWSSMRGAPSLGHWLDGLAPPDLSRLQDLARERLRIRPDGSIRLGARANAVRGTKTGGATVAAS